MRVHKLSNRKKIKLKIRKNVNGTSDYPRLSVYRSNKEIYAQLIDDDAAKTVLAVSTKTKSVDYKGTKLDKAKKVGSTLAERAKEAGIDKCKFDRNGFLYHGRVKALAEGAREKGLQF